MRALLFVVGFGILATQALASGGAWRLEVVQRIALGAVQERGIYRVATCPNGLSVVTHSGGSVMAVSAEGVILFNRAGMKEVAGATASACDAENRLWLAGDGKVQRFEFTPSGGLRLLSALRVDGGVNRILIAGSQLYLLGLAKSDDAHVILRRFLLPGGDPLGVLKIDLPLWCGNKVNQLLLNGSLLLAGERVVYSPANPFEFWIFDRDGRRLEIKQPRLAHFGHVDVEALRQAPPLRWRMVDWAFNAVSLPDGAIVVQMMKGNDAPRPPEGTAPNNWLAVFDGNLDLVADLITADELGSATLLAGADASGNLYFAHLNVPLGGELFKVRLARR
jgi:hypothetical protein